MTLSRITSLAQRRRVQAIAIVLLVPFLAMAPLHLLKPATAKAHGGLAPGQFGISFSPRRAASFGLDYRKAFPRGEPLPFRAFRLSLHSAQACREGCIELDRLVRTSKT